MGSDNDAPHEHEWQIDDSEPTFDVLPVHYALQCACGATACGNPAEAEVHEIYPPQPTEQENQGL